MRYTSVIEIEYIQRLLLGYYDRSVYEVINQGVWTDKDNSVLSMYVKDKFKRYVNDDKVEKVLTDLEDDTDEYSKLVLDYVCGRAITEYSKDSDILLLQGLLIDTYELITGKSYPFTFTPGKYDDHMIDAIKEIQGLEGTKYVTGWLSPSTEAFMRRYLVNV